MRCTRSAPPSGGTSAATIKASGQAAPSDSQDEEAVAPYTAAGWRTSLSFHPFFLNPRSKRFPLGMVGFITSFWTLNREEDGGFWIGQCVLRLEVSHLVEEGKLGTCFYSLKKKKERKRRKKLILLHAQMQGNSSSSGPLSALSACGGEEDEISELVSPTGAASNLPAFNLSLNCWLHILSKESSLDPHGDSANLAVGQSTFSRRSIWIT